MQRRRFLWLAGGWSAALAGCQAGPDGEPTGTATSPAPRVTTEPPSTATVEPPDSDLAVAITDDRYLLWADELPPEHRAIEPGDITPATDLPEVLRSALDAAREGGYATDDVSDELLAAIDGFRQFGAAYRFEPYVSLDQRPYAIEAAVPEFGAWLEPVEPEAADPDRTIEYDDIDGLDDTARDFVRTIAAFTPQVPYDEYRVSIVPEPVRAFLEAYEYVKERRGTTRIQTERVDPGPPYTITLRELTLEDRWGRRVVDGADLPDAQRQFLETVVGSDRRAPALPPARTEYRTDDLPAGFVDRFDSAGPTGRDPYAALDGAVYGFQVVAFVRDRIPVTIDATVAPGDPRAFTLTLRPSEAGAKPAVEGAVEVAARGVLPSVLWVETEADRFLLPSDAYESVIWAPAESGACVDRRVQNVARATLQPDDAIETTYRVPEATPAGTHRLWGRFTASWTSAGTGRTISPIDYPFQVALSVTDG